jgi:hypothetical protein
MGRATPLFPSPPAPPRALQLYAYSSFFCFSAQAGSEFVAIYKLVIFVHLYVSLAFISNEVWQSVTFHSVRMVFDHFPLQSAQVCSYLRNIYFTIYLNF